MSPRSQINEEAFHYDSKLRKPLPEPPLEPESLSGSPLGSSIDSRTPSEAEMDPPTTMPELTPDMSPPYEEPLEKPNPLYGQAFAYDSEPEHEIDNSPPESTRLGTSSSTGDLSGFQPGISPITRVKRRSSRPMSQLRDSTLFENSEGSSDFRLSIMNNFEGRNGSRLSIISTASNVSLPERNSRLSTTLTTQLPMLEIYRDSALKTKDLEIQMEYAKFIFDQLDNLKWGAYYNEDDYKIFDPNFNPVSDEAFNKLIEEGVFWIKRLFKKHHPDATYLIGTWYESGINGCSLNLSKAHGLYLSASKLGSAAAMFKMAMYHEKRKEISKSLAYYKKACSRCDPTANYRMGIAFIYGELKLQRSTRAAQFYLRRSADYATRESPQGAYTWALILLGLYEEDLGFRDPIEAKEVLEKCAELDYEPAQYQLGYNYEFGEHGCPVDPSMSIGYYRRAAIRGYAKAQMSMSSWYLTGAPLVLMQSDELAYKWCQKAANQGLSKAMYAMGYYNELGVGVEPDEEAAIQWYTKAVSQGSEEASQRLEKLKEERRRRLGNSVKKEPETGKKKKSKKGGCIIC